MLPVDRKLRYGMVGGGRGAFSGGVHRIAAALDGQAELVAGVFSSDPQRSYESGADLLLPPERLYGSYEDMAAAEAKLPLIQRLDFVTLVTPNHMHYGPAKRFLEAGINVVCDKPVTLTLEEAQDLKNIVARTRKVFVVTQLLGQRHGEAGARRGAER